MEKLRGTLKYLVVLFKCIIYTLFLPIYYVSYIIPRDRNLWIFDSWTGYRFSDNSKYLFLYTKKNHPEIRAIWLTYSDKVLKSLRREGYEVYKLYSVRGFLYSMTAACIIVSSHYPDITRFMIGGAQKIQLWHGTPLKRLGYDVSTYKTKSKFKGTLVSIKNKVFPFLLHNYSDIFIAASKESKEKLASAFRIRKDKILITGYPRNDALFNTQWSTFKCDYLDNIRNKVSFKYIFTYLPTFRKKSEKLDMLREYGFNIHMFEQKLEELNAIFIIKTHFSDKKVDLPTNEENLKRIYNLSDCILSDIYPLLKETDVLITDYSSVYFDYLLLNRPIIFAPFDIDIYVKKYNGFYYTYGKVTPGPKAKDWPQVIRLMEEVIKKDRWKKERKTISNYFNTFRDNRNSERVFEIIKKLSSQ